MLFAPITVLCRTLVCVRCWQLTSLSSADACCCLCRCRDSTLTLAPTTLGTPKQNTENKVSEKITAGNALSLYLYHAHWFIVLMAFIWFLAPQTTRQVSDFWVRWWVDDKHDQFDNPKKQDPTATKYYSLLYLLLVGIFFFGMLFRGSFFLAGVLRSAERMRKRALHNVLNAPMGFFLVTPVGDLLLNVSKDQDILDENLPDAIRK